MSTKNVIVRALPADYVESLIERAKPVTRANPFSEGKLAAAGVEVPLDDITRDETLQPRDGLKDAHVRAIQTALESGVEMPPVVLYQLGDTLALVDGWHRFAAHQRAGKVKISADLYDGDRDDAIAHAGAANVGDKLGLTASERVSFLLALLKLPKYRKLSDRALARMVGVAAATVAKYKRQIDQGAAQNEQPDTRSVSLATAAADLEGITQHPAPGRVLRRSEGRADEIQPRHVQPGEALTVTQIVPPAPPEPAVRHVAAYTSRKRVVGVGWLRECEDDKIAILYCPDRVPVGLTDFLRSSQIVAGGAVIIPLELHSEGTWAELVKQGLALLWWATGPGGEVWLVWGAGRPPRGVPSRVGDLGELISALDAGRGLLVEI
jgi:hypothetical protein